MRIYHPKHGILFTTDQAEIDQIINAGGVEFDVNNKPWIKKESTVEKEVVQENTKFAMNTPKRGRPFKHGNN